MTCGLCNGTQLMPFIKQGRTIPNVMLDCICKENEPEHFNDTRPEDFDYPMSNSFRETTFELYGRACDRRPETYQSVATAPPSASQPWDKRQRYQLDQTRNELTHIRHKLLEMTSKKLEPGKQHPVKKSNYKGLVVE